MSRADRPTSTPSVEALLRSGLDHYGRNEINEAVARWNEVLGLDPTNEQALDFLQTAGIVPEKPSAQVLPFPREPSSIRASSEPPAPSEASSSTRLVSIAPEALPQLTTPDGDLADPELKTLLIERRFEDALQRLYSLRSKRPKDEGLSRSIQLLREKLADVYSEQLVHLDRVPRLTTGAERHAFSSDERHVAGLVDGISSFGDIVAASKLGRVPSLRILCQLQQTQLLTSSSSSIAAPRRVGPVLANSSKAQAQTPPSAAPYQPPPKVKPTTDQRSVPISGPQSSATTPRDPVPPSVDGPRTPSNTRPKTSTAPTSDSLPKSHERPLPSQVAEPKAADVKAAELKAAAGSAYEARFAQATHYYLVRDFDRAIELFRQCEAERPDDARPRHNLKAIQNRTGKS